MTSSSWCNCMEMVVNILGGRGGGWGGVGGGEWVGVTDCDCYFVMYLFIIFSSPEPKAPGSL